MCRFFMFFFFNDTATTEIYTLSLHDALPILTGGAVLFVDCPSDIRRDGVEADGFDDVVGWNGDRSEEHTSELQSQSNLVCRLLLEKKNEHDFAVAAPAHSVTRHVPVYRVRRA